MTASPTDSAIYRHLFGDAEMARFRDGELDVLVGTTVVEVGVDVPEATMMIVVQQDAPVRMDQIFQRSTKS